MRELLSNSSDKHGHQWSTQSVTSTKQTTCGNIITASIYSHLCLMFESTVIN